MSFLQQGLGGGPTSEPFAQQGLCAELERRSYLRGICTAGAEELCARRSDLCGTSAPFARYLQHF